MTWKEPSGTRLRAAITLFCVLNLLIPAGLFPRPAEDAPAVTATEPARPRSNHDTQVNVAGPFGIQVNTATGNLFYPLPILSIPGRGLPLELVLSYNGSWHDFAAHYGYGWQLSYNMFYMRDEHGDVFIVWEDGRVDSFIKSDGTFLSPVDTHATLEEYLPGKYLLRDKQGLERYFDSPIHKRLSKIREPDGNALTFAYDADLHLASITDTTGRQVTFTFVDGYLQQITDPASRSFQFQYDGAGNLIAVINPLGQRTDYGYDGEHFLTSITNPRAVTATITYSAGAVSNLSCESTSKSFAYDPVNRITTVTDAVAGGDRTSYFYYDAEERIQRLERVKDELGNVASRSFLWDENNNLLSLTDENGNTTTYTYDARGNVLTATPESGVTTTFTYESTYNKLTSITDANGRLTTFEYDARGNFIRQTNPLGQITSYTYNSLGDRIGKTDANGITTFAYDLDGNLTAITDPLGQTRSATYDAVSNQLTATDGNGHTTTYTYDPLNRLLTSSDPLTRATMFEYDPAGNLQRRTDPDGHSLDYAYDGLDRLTGVTDALGHETLYTYDAAGNLTAITDAEVRTTAFVYDRLNRLIRETDPLLHATTYLYDDAGNLIQKTDAEGNVVAYGYDALNRVTAIDYPGTAYDVSYAYDAVGNRTQESSSLVTVASTYDALNRVIAEEISLPGFTKTIGYTYDAAGNRATTTDPDGGVTTYAYDAADRLITLTNPLGQVTGYSYDAGGRPTRRELANGTYTTYEYDAADQPIAIMDRRSDDGAITTYAYQYDLAGRRTRAEENGGVTLYAHDDLGRLTSVTYPDASSETFTYDAVGNRLSRTDAGGPTTYAYDAADRLTSAGAVVYAWDGDANLIAKTDAGGTTSYAYGFDDRLVAVTLPDSSVESYSYYPDGRRLSKTDPAGQTLYYFYDGPNVAVETDAAGTTLARYTSGLEVDEWISMDRGGGSHFYHLDALGSVRRLTDPGETVAASFEYDAFGSITSETGTVVNPYRFTGREYDETSGLYYLRARHYDAQIGRFTTKDSHHGELEVPATLHRYVYARNAPADFVDPHGTWSLKKTINKVTKTVKKTVDAIKHPIKKIVGERGWQLVRVGYLLLRTKLVIEGWSTLFAVNLTPIAFMSGPVAQAIFLAILIAQTKGVIEDWRELLKGGGTRPPGPGQTAGGGMGGVESKPMPGISPSVFLGPILAASAAGPDPGGRAPVRNPRLLDVVAALQVPRPRRPRPAIKADLVELADVIPATGPAGTVATPVTPPAPIGGATNAVDALAMDFVDPATSETRATVFATKSIDRAYEHDYPICNRFHGYVLESAAAVALPGVLPGDPAVPWFWYLSTTRAELVEETFLFAVFVDEHTQTFAVDSRWMSDLYPAPPVPDYEYVLNFQIWASSSEDAHDLLRRTLVNLDGFGPGWTVRFDNTAEPSPPSVVIREAELDGAVVRMTVRSWLDETRSVHFYGNMAFPSDRVTSVPFDLEIEIAPGFNTVELPLGSILDAVVQVDVDGFLDRVYVGTGTWFPFDDTASGGSSTVTMELPDCAEASNLTLDDLVLPGCVRLTGSVAPAGWVGMARTLNPNGRAIDVRQHQALTFFARGDGKSYRVLLETASVAATGSADFHQMVFTASSEWRQIVIPLAAFEQQGWDPVPVPFTGEDVKAVVFVSVGSPLETIELEIDRVAFFSSTLIRDTTALADTGDVLGPYPVESRISDDVGIGSATLFYRAAPEESFTALPMAPADGDLYAAAIPGQPLGTEVRYYLAATDGDGNLAHDPPDAPYATYRFQVSQHPYLLVDDFSDTDPDNATGGESGVFGDLTGATITPHFDGERLRLDFDVTPATSYAGYTSDLGRRDLSGYDALTFEIRGARGGETVKVALRDAAGNEPKIVVGEYLRQGIRTWWQKVTIPLRAFTAIDVWTQIERFVIAFEERIGSGAGTIYLDDVRCEHYPVFVPVVVDNFNDQAGENGVAGSLWSGSGGGAGIDAAYDPANRFGDFGAGYAVTTWGVSATAWAAAGTDLMGLDASGASHLSLLVKGGVGGEEPNLYLASGSGASEVRSYVDLEDYLTVTTSWQYVEIPLADFVAGGVDLSDLSYFQVVFEWDQPDGTFYLDDVKIWEPPPLLAHWKLDEASWSGVAGEVRDSSGHGHHGTARNGATTVPGIEGRAGSFDGINDHVRVPDAAGLDPGAAVGLCLWVKVAAASQSAFLAGKSIFWSADDYGLYLEDGRPGFFVSGATSAVAAVTLSRGRWYHLVGSFDGGQIRLLVDGVAVATTPSAPAVLGNDEPFTFGAVDGAAFPFAGLIDDVRLFGRALTVDEAAELFAQEADLFADGFESGDVSSWSRVVGN